MSANLVTGYAGRAHVTSADQALFNAGVCGTGKYVMQTNDRFAYTINSSNSISISSGDLVNQGRHINIPINTEIDVNIETGKGGYHRIDTIAMRYEKDSNTGIESADLVVVKGTAVALSETPNPPQLITGNIFEGDAIDDFALYNVEIEELTITSVNAVFDILPVVTSMWDIIYPIGSIYMSVNDTNPAILFGGAWEQISNRFLLGAGSVAAGKTGGASSVTLKTDNLPSHSHAVNSHTHSIAQHTHTASSASAGAHTHGVYYRTDNTTGGSSQRVGSSSSNAGTHSTKSAGAHSHTITVGKGGPTATGATSPGTSAVGGGKAFSIEPPYLAVYMWKRIS